MNFIKLKINLAFLSLIIIAGACSDKWALKEETFIIADENSDWVPLEVPGESFLMTDNNGITQGFIMDREEHYLDKSWGGFLGLNTHMTHTEYRSRSYSSTYGHNYYIAIRAATWEPYGDELSISLMDLDFRYDLLLGKVSSLFTPFCRISYVQTSEGYESEDTIVSTCEILESITIGDRTYNEVLHFTLLDKPDQWSNTIPTDIYVSKGIGLIRYILNIGVTYDLAE